MRKNIFIVLILLITVKGFSQKGGTKDFIFVEGNKNLASFYICSHEVTEAEYLQIMENRTVDSKLPAGKVLWREAIAYCNKRSEKEGLTPCYKAKENDKYECDFTVNGYRLPTDVEWEYAASGGNKSKGYEYSGSNSSDDVAWNELNSDNTFHEVMTKKPNELSIYDMSGNVWEWVNDWEKDLPKLRGGSYFSDGGNDCQTTISAYTYADPDFRFKPFGLRVVRSTIIAKDKVMSAQCNLKLRAEESTDSEVKTVMQAGTAMKILEFGKSEIIDNIRSNWVRVEIISGTDKEGKTIKKNTTGWCYGGYLQ
ncbi:MAG: SUMF1/EgtB/PvdO family nonheme iron enzyme [Treponema sp.]|nr:SUMF1/EgtB/PvdO family nonheme iron enzyme [Treponema sp.]